MNENPVDYRDRLECESCLTFAIVCMCGFGFLANLINLLTHIAARL